MAHLTHAFTVTGISSDDISGVHVGKWQHVFAHPTTTADSQNRYNNAALCKTVEATFSPCSSSCAASSALPYFCAAFVLLGSFHAILAA